MAEFYEGQQVRIKSIEELCVEFDFCEEEIEHGVLIGSITLTPVLAQYCGGTYEVSDVDTRDHSVYINEAELWFSFEMLDDGVSKDDFDFHFGFKVGDIVEFRDWDEMQADGSLDYNWFVEGMQPLCGTRAKITSIHKRDRRMAEVEMEDLNGNDIHWNLNTAMIQPICDVPDVEFDDWRVILDS